MPQTGGFQTSAADLQKAPSPDNVCHAHCQCHGHPLPPWVQNGLPWPCTHLPLTTKASAGWAGDPCLLRHEKRHGEFRSTWAVPGTWPRALSHSLPVAAPCPHGRVLSRGGHRGQAGPEPADNSTGPASGSRSARRRDGDWAAAPKGRALSPHAARLPTGPVPRGQPLCDTLTCRQEQAPDPEVVPED